MPNNKLDAVRLNDFGEMLDRRRKLSLAQRLEIVQLYKAGGVSQRTLAERFGVSRRLIQFVVDPEKREANVRVRNERGGWYQYYDKEQHRNRMRSLRERKRVLLADKPNADVHAAQITT